ncbi:MAG: hypothetical protein IKD06_04930 [Clostridia bacterium]|nr:hypothetical protein [Clostridia bacterium]
MKQRAVLFLVWVLCVMLVACSAPASDPATKPSAPAVEPTQPQTQHTSPDDSLEEIYVQAVSLIGRSQYAEAYTLLLQLGDYRDAKQLLEHFVWKYTGLTETTNLGGDLTTVYTYTYDENGLLVASDYESEYYANAYTYTYELDEKGRVLSQKASSTAGYETEITYEYDAQGRVSKETSVYGGSDVQVIMYEYDSLGRLVKETMPNDPEAVCYTYDERGHVTRKTIGDSHVVTFENEYDAKGRLAKCVRTESGYSLEYEYTYDQYGNLTKEVESEQSGTVKTKEYSGYTCFYQA